MDKTTYPSGPDLSPYFPLPPKVAEHPLPPAFSDLCKACEEPMERLPALCWTRRRPFAIFQCPACKKRLLLFEAPITPLLVWSDSYTGCADFSGFIDKLIEERERKREIRTLREQGVLET